MAKKSKRDNEAADQPPSFEEALTELQRIVADLEDGALGLEESLSRFETGARLLGTCHRALEQAEQRIAILTGVDAEGEPVTAPFDASATFDAPQSTAVRPAGRRRSRQEEPACDGDAEHTLFQE